MPITFTKTQNLRTTCILPCALPQSLTITIPFMAEVPGLVGLKGGGKLELKGGCTDCSLAVDLFAKITPFVISLGIPLCLIQCAMALLNVVTASIDLTQDSVGLVSGLAEAPPKFPTPGDVKEVTDTAADLVTNKVPALIQDCRCVLDLATPLGLCPFIKLVRDVLRLVAALANCFATLLGDVIKLSIRANFMRVSPNFRIREQGVCLGSLMRNQLNRLTGQMDVVWAIVLLLGAVFGLIELIPGYPPEAKITPIIKIIEAFQAKATGMQGISLDLLVPKCEEMRDAAFEIRDALNYIAELLNIFTTVVGCPLCLLGKSRTRRGLPTRSGSTLLVRSRQWTARQAFSRAWSGFCRPSPGRSLSSTPMACLMA